jgi:hypothetical protein
VRAKFVAPIASTRLYVVGYYHLRSELDVAETAELAELIDKWRDRVIVTTTISALEIYETNDDLALSARIRCLVAACSSADRTVGPSGS